MFAVCSLRFHARNRDLVRPCHKSADQRSRMVKKAQAAHAWTRCAHLRTPRRTSTASFVVALVSAIQQVALVGSMDRAEMQGVAWRSSQGMKHLPFFRERNEDRVSGLVFGAEPRGAVNVTRESHEERWEAKFIQLLFYKQHNGHCDVPLKVKPISPLATWVNWQRENRKQGRLSKERSDRLSELGFQWVFSDRKVSEWLQRFAELMKFKQDFGHCDVPRRWSTLRLGSWVSWSRQQQKKGTMPDGKQSLLTALGFSWELWDPRKGRREQWLHSQHLEHAFRSPRTEARALRGARKMNDARRSTARASHIEEQAARPPESTAVLCGGIKGTGLATAWRGHLRLRGAGPAEKAGGSEEEEGPEVSPMMQAAMDAGWHPGKEDEDSVDGRKTGGRGEAGGGDEDEGEYERVDVEQAAEEGGGMPAEMIPAENPEQLNWAGQDKPWEEEEEGGAGAREESAEDKGQAAGGEGRGKRLELKALVALSQPGETLGLEAGEYHWRGRVEVDKPLHVRDTEAIDPEKQQAVEQAVASALAARKQTPEGARDPMVPATTVVRLWGAWSMGARGEGSVSNVTCVREVRSLNEPTIDIIGGPWSFSECGLRSVGGTAVLLYGRGNASVTESVIGSLAGFAKAAYGITATDQSTCDVSRSVIQRCKCCGVRLVREATGKVQDCVLERSILQGVKLSHFRRQPQS